MDHELSDSVTLVDLDFIGWIQVDKDDFKLTSIVGVYKTGRVDYRQTLLNSQATARLNEASVSIGQRDRKASRDQASLEGLKGAVLIGTEVQTGISGMGVFGKLDRRVETLNVDRNVGHKITLACRALAKTHRCL